MGTRKKDTNKNSAHQEVRGHASWGRRIGDGPDPLEVYSSMIEIMPMSAIVFRMDDVICYANIHAARLHGYERPEELIGIKASDLIISEERAGAIARRPRFENMEYERLELSLLRKNGTRFIAGIHFSPLRDPAGEQCGFLAMAYDITERKRSEMALRESEERNRLVTEMSTDYVFKIRLHDDGSMKMTYVSENFAELTGRTMDEIASSDIWSDVIHPDDREAFLGLEKKVVASSEPSELECRSFLKNGAMRWIRILVRPILDPDTGAVASIIGAVKDITESKINEERIKASLSEKETLLKEIHHRVKNNLQIITSLLGLQARYQNNPDLQRQFEEAQNRIRSMALVHEKLYRSDNFSHIDFRSYISRMVDEVMASYSVRVPIQRRIEIEDVHVSIDQAVPCGLIVNELLTNAIKYAFPEGWKGMAEITISFHRKENGAAELVISDNGIGVPAGIEMGKTDSLGFSLVPMLARQLHGEAKLDRSSGSRFTILFGAPNAGME